MAARNELRLRRVSPSDLFRAAFCACAGETPPLVVDVRPRSAFSRGRVAGSYCVRASANGAALVDYSGGGQTRPWAQGVWHDAQVILLSGGGDDDEPPLDSRHPVAAFLIAEGAARSVAAVKGGFAAVSAEYPFVCGGGAAAHYPSEVLPRQLYLGDWANAEDHAALRHLRITHLLTIHNMPETLRAPPPGVSHLRQVLADVETEDVASHFGAAVAFIEAAVGGGGRVLVHCGAGVSRSAALVAAYLCATRRCGAAKALKELKALRSCVAPNAGFLRQLEAFAAQHAAPPAAATAAQRPAPAGAAIAGWDDAGDGDAAPPGGGAWLEVSKDGAVVSRLPLPPPDAGAVFTVGRAPGCGLALEHASVSRAHAALTWRDGRWRLRDHRSAHGTWLEGARLAPGAEATLRDGDVMRFGASTRSVAFRAPPAANPAAELSEKRDRGRSRSRSRSPQKRRRS